MKSFTPKLQNWQKKIAKKLQFFCFIGEENVQCNLIEFILAKNALAASQGLEL
jgi:hypothetical protein